MNILLYLTPDYDFKHPHMCLALLTAIGILVNYLVAGAIELRL